MMEKPCIVCGKPVKVTQRRETPVCKGCIAKFWERYNSQEQGHCYLCWKEVPTRAGDRGGRGKHYCCDKHAKTGKLLITRENTQQSLACLKELPRTGRAGHRGQHYIDETNARARANGRSYGMQKAIEMGRI